MTVTIENRLPGKLAEVANRIPEAASDLLGKAGFDMHGVLQATSPFRTGHLRESHQPQFSPGALLFQEHIAAEYAGYVRRHRSWADDAAADARNDLIVAFRALERSLE